MLLGVAVRLLWLLARRLAPVGAALPAFAVVVAVVLWPGVIVRSTSIGNTPLEVPLTLAFLLVLSEAHSSRRWRLFAAAGALLGLCLWRWGSRCSRRTAGAPGY